MIIKGLLNNIQYRRCLSKHRHLFVIATVTTVTTVTSLLCACAQEVGKEYLDYLIDERRYEDAARLCVRHLGNNRQLWQREAFRFSELQQLKVSEGCARACF